MVNVELIHLFSLSIRNGKMWNLEIDVRKTTISGSESKGPREGRKKCILNQPTIIELCKPRKICQ